MEELQNQVDELRAARALEPLVIPVNDDEEEEDYHTPARSLGSGLRKGKKREVSPPHCLPECSLDCLLD